MKRPKTVKLTIPAPCSQRWDEMAHTDTGRLCKYCDKAVIDFTSFSDQQIQDFFSITSTSVCGRFSPNQINRTIAGKRDSKSSHMPSLFAGAALAIGVLTEGEAKEAVVKSVEAQVYVTPEAVLNNPLILPPDSIPAISGRVIDAESHEALPSVSITLKGTSYRTVTDVSGHFALKVPNSVIEKNLILVCTWIGFQTLERSIRHQDLPLNITMSLYHEVLGEVVAVPKKRFWERLPKIKSPK